VTEQLDDLRRELAELLRRYSFSYGDFVLSSGLRSSYYYDGRLVTLSPRGAYLVGRLVFEAIKDDGIEAIGGKTLGADPIVTAVALVSGIEGRPIPAFIVRAAPKDHGKAGLIVEAFGENGGPLLRQGTRVAIVDDAATTGGSLLDAANAAEERGCTIARVVTLVDRQQGAAEAFAARGYPFTALYLANEQGELTVPAAVSR
jgi:orotate phosphoribosyltransferase